VQIFPTFTLGNVEFRLRVVLHRKGAREVADISDAEDCRARTEALSIREQLEAARERRRRRLPCRPECWCKGRAAAQFYELLNLDLGAVDESPMVDHSLDDRPVAQQPDKEGTTSAPERST
jgi:hypothetical protein